MPQRPLERGPGEREVGGCVGERCGVKVGSISPASGRIHPLAILYLFPSPHPQNSSREPSRSPGSQGFRKSLIMSAVAGPQAASPSRTEQVPAKWPRPARKGERGACGCAGAVENERHSQWQKRRLRAARPLEIDRQGEVTSGSWLRICFFLPPITTTLFLVSPPPNSEKEGGFKEGGEAGAAASSPEPPGMGWEKEKKGKEKEREKGGKEDSEARRRE